MIQDETQHCSASEQCAYRFSGIMQGRHILTLSMILVYSHFNASTGLFRVALVTTAATVDAMNVLIKTLAVGLE